MHDFILAHQVGIAFWTPFIVGAMIDALPDPTPQSSQFYTWFFKASHAIVGRLRTASNATNQDRRNHGG
jgi:hypothetical protein